jgi:hypothetical protein
VDYFEINFRKEDATASRFSSLSMGAPRQSTISIRSTSILRRYVAIDQFVGATDIAVVLISSLRDIVYTNWVPFIHKHTPDLRPDLARFFFVGHFFTIVPY